LCSGWPRSRHARVDQLDWDTTLDKQEKAPWIPTVKDDRDTHLFEPYEVNDEIDPTYVDSGNWDKDF